MPSTRVLTLLIDVTLAIWGGELGGARQEAGRPEQPPGVGSGNLYPQAPPPGWQAGVVGVKSWYQCLSSHHLPRACFKQ